MKRRLVAVTGVIVVVLAVVVAVAASGTASRTVTIAQALDEGRQGQKLQVTGTVVDDSYQIVGDTLTFDLYDPSGNTSTVLPVRFDGGVAATFGNGVTAICTGKIDESGVLQASEMITKCPSKYESGTEALSVSGLLGYGDNMIGNPVMVTGQVVAGSIKSVEADARLIISDPQTGDELKVIWREGLDSNITDGSTLVLTGALDRNGMFAATDVALKG